MERLLSFSSYVTILGSTAQLLRFAFLISSFRPLILVITLVSLTITQATVIAQILFSATLCGASDKDPDSIADNASTSRSLIVNPDTAEVVQLYPLVAPSRVTVTRSNADWSRAPRLQSQMAWQSDLHPRSGPSDEADKGGDFFFLLPLLAIIRVLRIPSLSLEKFFSFFASRDVKILQLC